jgi:hypothetical protein
VTKEGVTGGDATIHVLSGSDSTLVGSPLAPDEFKLESIRTRVLFSFSNGSTHLGSMKLLVILCPITTIPLSPSLNRKEDNQDHGDNDDRT